MLKVGDTVKVISKTMCNGEEEEFIPIGTICEVTEICEDDNSPYYGITKDGYTFYYLESELEKGNLVWIPEKKLEKLSKAVCISTKSKDLETGAYYYIDARENFMVKTKDGVSYVDVYTSNYVYLGMAPRRAFAILKTKAQAREILCGLKGMHPNMETLYEDVIVSDIGEEGLYALRSHHLIETCGMFEGRKLYAV